MAEAKTIGEILHQLRSDRKLSQQQLADRLFVDRSSISSWESGRRVPDMKQIQEISKIFEVDPLMFFPSEIPENVILVDDEDMVREGALEVLREALPGATINDFSDPEEAILYVKRNSVSLAFLDIEIGQVSGLDLCRELLEIDSQLNIIFVTAYWEFSIDAWDTGARGYVLKPLTVEAVKKQIENLHKYAKHRSSV